jgi:hypothetical protein
MLLWQQTLVVLPTVTEQTRSHTDFINSFNSLSIPASIKLQLNFHNLQNFCFTAFPKNKILLHNKQFIILTRYFHLATSNSNRKRPYIYSRNTSSIFSARLMLSFPPLPVKIAGHSSYDFTAQEWDQHINHAITVNTLSTLRTCKHMPRIYCFLQQKK